MIKRNLDALDEIKAKIFSLKGTHVDLTVNKGRKRYDTFSGIVQNAYPSVFTFKTQDNIRTFSYFDVLCGNVVFKIGN